MAATKQTNPTAPGHDCGTCASRVELEQMGIRLDSWDHVVALAGNPNTGKSSVFNSLTGLKQHVGNWPGKTVSRAEGGFRFNGLRYKLVDLPGTYSLLSASKDEEISRDFILFGKPDCIIVVADATALERNLNLALQVMEITGKVVLCVNLLDEAKRKGITVDLRSLSRDLGVPCVGTVARTGEGLGDLMRVVAAVIAGEVATVPIRTQVPAEVERALDELVMMIEGVAPGLPNARWVACRLLDGDLRIRQALLSGELARLTDRQQDAPVAAAPSLVSIQGAQ
ncbi:MAG: 50S ribosome-binding GTPase [Bryobacterales bacterium]|nr:50S ribosome-binding GTPase [Bryobacterales bacterium]